MGPIVRKPVMKSVAVCIGALALAAFGVGCASTTRAVPRPFPMPGHATRAPGPGSEPGVPPLAGSSQPRLIDTYALVGTALQLRGTPYRNGGGDPFGFDCSGFTQYVFAQYQIGLPREVRDQFKVGGAVDFDDLAAGDLIFFSTTDPGASHVGIVVGSDEFVHAPSSTGVVRVERVSSSYWSGRYLGARRVTPP
jgi:NlpC/P60 family protein